MLSECQINNIERRPRDVISAFYRGGQNFDRLPRGGQNMKNTQFCKQIKTPKSHYFSKSGGGGK